MERRRRFQVVCIAILAVMSISNFCFAKYSGGDGSAENPYKIANPNDLLVLAADANDYNDCFILINNINLAGLTFTTAVIARDTDLSPGGFDGTPFTGVFDGNDHSILNLTIDADETGNASLGLFGKIGSEGLIKNLGIEDVNIIVTIGDSYYSDFVGGLCGYNSYGSITNCYSTGSVAGDCEAGGLVGENYHGTITDSFSIAAITGGHQTGGLVGFNLFGSIINCYSTGQVSGGWYAGGFCGESNAGNISGCFSTGKVTGNYNTGGLVGTNEFGSISNCYSTGSVNGGDFTGGLCGVNHSNIGNCYATGSVTGSDYTGGLCGYTQGNINNCYATGSITGNMFTGGLCGVNYDSITSCFFLDTAGPDNGLGEPLTDALMKQQASFINWDFSYTDGNPADWFIQINEYPILTWQISPADLYTDGKNNFKDWAIFAGYWQRDDCAIYNDYCEWADMNFDGYVDIDDLTEFISYWLEEGIY